jgi:two-component system cell cycle response regulator DivK
MSSEGPLVLIVEDNDKNMKLVRDILRFKGYRTLEATSGREGVRLALAERPDLVLMDVQLPDIDGVAALQELRADPAAAAMTVVALTAFAMKSDRERFLSAGFDGYITKPISVREFPEQVRQYCEQGRAE